MDRIKKAFTAVERTHFLPESVKGCAGVDTPIPIGFNQTNSQPTTVRLMLSWLDTRPGGKVLDVGSGSGWTTALLSYLVGAAGSVFAVEKVPELVTFGKDNCWKAGIKNARFFEAGPTIGLPEFAPYDRILVSAAAIKLPRGLLSQLKIGGRLVIPIGNSIHVLNKTSSDSFESTEHRGFVFVPLL